MTFTQARLKALLHYDPATGVFRWRVSRQRVKAGDVAGYTHGDGYIVIKIDGNKYNAHRLAWLYMTGAWPKALVDHRDVTEGNNSWENLREATRSQNKFNSRLHKNNKTGVKGVSRIGNKFQASIKKNGHKFHLGTFNTVEEAAAEVTKARKALHGEFARAA